MPSTPDERSSVIVVPTELDRRNPFYDLAALAFVIIVVKYLSLYDLHWYAVPLVLIVGIWTLSGEPATDVAGIGLIASAVRSKLGLRRAHEWLFAWAHYMTVAVWPREKERWQNSRLRSKIATSHISRRLLSASGAIRASKPRLFWSKP